MNDDPTASTFLGDFVSQHWIGDLIPDRSDLWWEIGPSTDISRLGQAVLLALRDYALPAMRAQTT